MTRDESVSSSEAGSALRAALVGQDWDVVAEVINAHWSILLAQDLPLLEEALSGAPDRIRQDQPQWATAAAYVGLVAGGVSAPTTYRDVVSRPRVERSLLDRVSELTSRSAGRRAVGDFDAAVEAAQRATDLLHTAADEERVLMKYVLPHLLIQLARSFELAGDERLALTTFTEAYDLGRVVDDDHAAALAASWIAWIHALAGRRLLAERWLLRTDTRLPLPVPLRIGEMLTRALLAVDALDFDAARAFLEQVVPDSGTECWAEILLVRASLARPEEGDQIIRTVEEEIAGLPTALYSRGTNADCLAIVIVLARQLQSQRGRASTDLQRLGIGTSTAATALAHAFANASNGDRAASVKLARSVQRGSSSHSRWSIMASLLLHALGDASERELRSVVSAAIQGEQLRSLSVIPTSEIPSLGLPPEIADRLGKTPVSESLGLIVTLSERERQILVQLEQGDSAVAIAASLFISLNTVKTHLKNIYRKLGVTRRDEAVAIARELGWA